MLVAAAVCPSAPVLVAGIGRPAEDYADLRRRSAAVVDAVTGVAADVCFLVGADTQPRATTLAPWAPGCSDLAAVGVPEPLPLALLVGAALLGTADRSYVAVDPELPADECAALGADLAGSADRVAMLVVADGAARHSERAPGYLDDRSPALDDAVADALARADAVALARLDPRLSAELLATGRAPWQVLAGAAGGPMTVSGAWFGAPYGVGYHIVTWRT